MKMNESEILEFINNLKGYQGYIQMSDRVIENIWEEFEDIRFIPKSGFVYEAHFWNGKDSITIKQINDSWLVDQNKNIPLTDTQIYFTKENNLKVKMAQIWKEEIDLLCENMMVLKLEKIVFAGFVGDIK